MGELTPNVTGCTCVWGVNLTSDDTNPVTRTVTDPNCPHHGERSITAENLRVIRHEAATPMRGHDEDGQCCRRARFGLEVDP